MGGCPCFILKSDAHTTKFSMSMEIMFKLDFLKDFLINMYQA